MKIAVGGYQKGYSSTCKVCKIEFEKSGQNNSFCSIKCRDKNRWLGVKYSTKYRETQPVKYLLRIAKQRAKLKGLEFTLKESDIILPTHCPVFGFELKLNLNSGAGGKENSFSLDRIDSSKGYIPRNVQVLSHKANSMKHTATKEELVQFANWILKND